MKKPAPLKLTVMSTQQVTPNMQRLTLYGDKLADFPKNCEGSYIKFLFNTLGETDLNTMSNSQRPVMRTYTIRRFFPSKCTIEVDFVRHASKDLNSGFATRWAMAAKEGDIVNIAGPGSSKQINKAADWFIMIADMTALPALSAQIRQLPVNAKGYALIKVTDKTDIQHIDAPKNINVIWLTDENSLVQKAKSLPWLNGIASVWSACEFEDMRKLRTYFQNDKDVARGQLYISSYWKRGISEDGHKVLKQQDAIKKSE